MEAVTGYYSSHCSPQAYQFAQNPGPPFPMLGLFSYPENGGSRFFQKLVTIY
jgi:hypothetical protein